jgi:hypothetical protein
LDTQTKTFSPFFIPIFIHLSSFIPVLTDIFESAASPDNFQPHRPLESHLDKYRWRIIHIESSLDTARSLPSFSQKYANQVVCVFASVLSQRSFD